MSTTALVSGSASALGGEPLNVIYRQAFESFAPGSSEVVTIRELEIDPGLLEFINLCGDEKRLAEFITGKPEGWATAISRVSLLEIVEKAMALNFTVAERWARLRGVLVEKMSAAGLWKSPTPSTSSAPVSG